MNIKGGFVVCMLIGSVTGVLVTRFAPQCTEGLCWGQTPYLVMFLAGAWVGGGGKRNHGDTPASISPYLIGAIAGAVVGLSVSFFGGLYVFLGGSTNFQNLETVTAMALIPNPLLGFLGGVLGILGTAVVTLIRRTLR